VTFYQQFVSEGDLVFDIGANRGERTEAFVRLGAKVVAAEPNPYCANLLKQIFRYCTVEVEPVAAGSQVGMLLLYRCDDDRMSSLSDEWIASVKSSRFQHLKWDLGQPVPIATLDGLIAKHGKPQFIKIDTEGFETSVLEGLTQAIQMISFEYTPECPDLARKCLSFITKLGHYEFNLSLGENLSLELTEWIDNDTLLKLIEQLTVESWKSPDHMYADIYCKHSPLR